MYRFLIDGEEWILRFSPQLLVEPAMKKVIADSVMQMEKELRIFAHGDSFLVMNELFGALIFSIEKIPSLILTVSNIIAQENWYIQKNDRVTRINK